MLPYQVTADDPTPSQAAAISGVSITTIRRWIKTGILPAYRVGPTLVRIRRADLDALATRIGGDDVA